MSEPGCSVVIPSYNRRDTLEMVLQGLERQTVPKTAFEVIVVLDGSEDDSAAMLAEWQSSGRLPHLRWHWQPNSGQASARNTGVRLAQAPVVVFLDDDVVPEPELLAVHLGWHEQRGSLAVLGDCLVAREELSSLCHLGAWAWWEDLFYQRALPGRQPTYHDFCTGNVSLRREDFNRVGGFDTDFRGYGREDYELGYRLLRAGVRFIIDRSARAWHHHQASVAGILRAARQEAHGDVLMGRKHPELRAGLRLMEMPAGRYGLLVRLAMQAPAVGDRFMPLVQRMLPIFQRTQMRRRWLLWFGHLRGYAYWRGVRDVLGSWEALLAFRAQAAPIRQARLDIRDGLPAELPPLLIEGPSLLTITWGEHCLGELYLPEALQSPPHSLLAERMIKQLWKWLWMPPSQTADPFAQTGVHGLVAALFAHDGALR